MRPPRLGELVALAGAVCIGVALTLRWYETPTGSVGAWHIFGVGVALLLAAALAGLALVVATLFERSPALPVAMAVWTTVLGAVAVIAAIVRALERPDGATGLCAGPWLALGGAFLIALGGWLSMRDERSGRYRAVRPERRPPPPA